MTDSLIHLTSELHRLMVDAEAAVIARQPSPPDAAARLRHHADTLRLRFDAARREVAERISATVEDVCANLRALVAELGRARPERKQLRSTWKVLGRNYEALLLYIRQVRARPPSGIRLDHLKPLNPWRNAFHVSMGLMGVLLYELVLSRTLTLAIGGAILGTFVLLDVLRRTSQEWNERLVQRIFAKISRPSEAHSIPSSTWFIAGLVLGVLLLPQRAIELGTLVLAFGDPVASIAGKRWGRLKLHRDKSLVGTTALIVTGTLVCWVFLIWVLPGLGLLRSLLFAAAISGSGAVAELFDHRLDDNFTIPLVAGTVAALLLM